MRRYQRRAPALVMCATIMFQTLYLDQEVRNDEEESRLTRRKHWRCGTTSVCCRAGDRRLLTGAASLVRIFLLPTGATHRKLVLFRSRPAEKLSRSLSRC